MKAKISVMIVEPDAVHQRYVNWAKWLHWRFYKVLTKNASLLKKIENGEFYYLGSTFINEESQIDLTKSKMASLIASARRDLEGHKLRHQTVDHIRSEGLDVDIMGRGYRPFKEKADGLAPYRYSVVIENVREQSYFTEKLVDACLCKTVPIYWGAPNISDYFDVRGMIICNNAAEINTALKNMSVSDYEARLKWIEKNEQAARHHANNIERAALLIRKTIDKKQERL
ncbi:glycosyltransferase family 10 [Pseudohalocynthiibacter sp. F2068]|nr:glycosyltransferase family 10 [Pseudohalocynthiibacter sp. F2068]